MAGFLWEVICGTKKNGIKVREGCCLTSPLHRQRLSKGAIVKQHEVVGTRLRYEIITGNGPEQGWVSIVHGSRDLLARVGPGVDTSSTPLTGTIGPPENVIACLGDSITSLGYPPYLNKLLKSSWDVLNLGVGGTMASRVCACPYVATQRFRRALRCGAGAFVLCFGTNDANVAAWNEANYIKGFRKILAALLAVPIPPARMILMTPPPAYPGSIDAQARHLHVLNNDLPNRILPELAQEFGVQLVDIFTPLGGGSLGGRRLMKCDGIHPDREGDEIIAGVVRDALCATLHRMR